MTVVATPKLRSSKVKAIEHLRKRKYDGLFLPLPRDLDGFLKDLSEGLPYTYVLSRLRASKLIPEPVGAWEYSVEPYLKVLSQIRRNNPNIKIYCYGDQLYSHFSMENAVETSLLTLRSSVTGKIDVEKWRRLVEKDMEIATDALRREADFIASHSGRHENCMCISGLTGGYIANLLREEGYKVETKYLDLPYYLTPLDILKSEARRGDITTDRIRELVSLHIDYIKKYVLLSKDPDEAYYKWVYEQAVKLNTPAVIA